MGRVPWIVRRRKSDPDLPCEPPVWLGARSNGEYFRHPNEAERLSRQWILRTAGEQAQKLGIDRREFLASAAGMATTLAAFNLVGCGGGSGASTDGGGGGAYDVGLSSDCEDAGGTAISSKGEFIFDVQTHHFDPNGSWRETNPAYATFLQTLGARSCDAKDSLECFSAERYIETMFLDSDTAVAVLSSWPAAICNEETTVACGLPLANDAIAATRDLANRLAFDSTRVVNHCQVMPNLVLDEQLAAMEETHRNFGVAGWKCYPAWGTKGVGFWLDDPAGLAFIEKGLELGVNVFCIHKGLPIPGFDVLHNYPWDIGRVAARYPEAKFIVYHTAICAGQDGFCDPTVEGHAYDPKTPRDQLQGTDTLIRSLEKNGIGPGSNVYAELGSAWLQVMTQPDLAAHFLGKLLRYVGPQNILWGTDSIVNGSPQPQIEAFRAFSISEKYQDLYGYPALDSGVKRRVFGLNAATIYGVDPTAKICKINKDGLAKQKQALDDEFGPRRWTLRPPPAPRTRREFLAFSRLAQALGRPA